MVDGLNPVDMEVPPERIERRESPEDQTEIRQAAEQVRMMNEATYEPEAAVQNQGDTASSEALQEALIAVAAVAHATEVPNQSAALSDNAVPPLEPAAIPPDSLPNVAERPSNQDGSPPASLPITNGSPAILDGGDINPVSTLPTPIPDADGSEIDPVSSLPIPIPGADGSRIDPVSALPLEGLDGITTLSPSSLQASLQAAGGKGRISIGASAQSDQTAGKVVNEEQDPIQSHSASRFMDEEEDPPIQARTTGKFMAEEEDPPIQARTTGQYMDEEEDPPIQARTAGQYMDEEEEPPIQARTAGQYMDEEEDPPIQARVSAAALISRMQALESTLPVSDPVKNQQATSILREQVLKGKLNRDFHALAANVIQAQYGGLSENETDTLVGVVAGQTASSLQEELVGLEARLIDLQADLASAQADKAREAVSAVKERLQKMLGLLEEANQRQANNLDAINQ